jgi:acyl carrier protein
MRFCSVASRSRNVPNCYPNFLDKIWSHFNVSSKLSTEETEHRLVRCFSLVFPNLAADQIRTAGIETIDEWDSLASVTLVAVLQEEFDVEIDLGDLPELVSFRAVLQYLDVRTVPRSAQH